MSSPQPLDQLQRRWSERTALRSSISRKQTAFPEAKNLRNIVEHLDEYQRGEGGLQRRQTGVPLDPTVLFIRSDVDDPESEIFYHFGFHLDLPLKAAAEAAAALAEKVETVEDEKAE